MHFYNTKGTHCPLPLPPITLCPHLSQLSQHLPAAQGVAVNQVSLELSRSRGWISLSWMEQNAWSWGWCEAKAMTPPALGLSTASFVWGCSLVWFFTVHSLVKASLIKGHLCSGGVLWVSSELAGTFRGSADMTTSLQCANRIWLVKIRHFLPWKTEKAWGEHSSTCAEVVVTLKPGAATGDQCPILMAASDLTWRLISPGSREKTLLSCNARFQSALNSCCHLVPSDRRWLFEIDTAAAVVWHFDA